MASIWLRPDNGRRVKGAVVPAPKSPPPSPGLNVHSYVSAAGQHLTHPPRTGGQPWIGHAGKTPQAAAFSPAESFHAAAAPVNMPNPSRLRSTVPAVVNSIVGQAAGTFQLAPGGGVNMPRAQVTAQNRGIR